MIKEIEIKNFKSIKNLQLNCKRVNLFIGEPNSGKSNILEGLSLLALPLTMSLDGLIRSQNLSSLFFENDVSNDIMLSADNFLGAVKYQNGIVNFHFSENSKEIRHFQGAFSDSKFGGATWDSGVHPYFFKTLPNFPALSYDFLAVPNGDNLFSMLQTKKNLRLLISDLIQERGFKLLLRQEKYEIEISKEEDSILVSYPHSVISDTLQRIIFFLSAIETNKKGTSLIFEEPESNVFPYYAKYLAEKIAYDTDKQFFLTTHNPYFLQSIMQKTPLDDLQVVIVNMPKYTTQIRPVVERKEIEELIDLDSNVFLNLERFLE